MNFEIIKEKTCAFTGHRILPKNFDTSFLERVINRTIEIGYDTFLVGMAVGFDTIVFNLLEKVRINSGIKIVACVPCNNQDLKFSLAQKKEYKKMLDSADYKIILTDKYTPTCMMERNKFMVDNSSILICYVTKNYGGSYATKKYAISKGIKVVEVK